MSPYQFSPEKHYLSSIVLEVSSKCLKPNPVGHHQNMQVDFFNKKNTTTDPFDTDQMAKEFSMQFPNQVSPWRS